MTPRAWAPTLLFAAGAALGVALWLLLAAQTVGVEAWHDSAVPASAFTAIRSAGLPVPTLHQLPTFQSAKGDSNGAVQTTFRQRCTR